MTFRDFSTANNYFATLTNKNLDQILAINSSFNFTSRYSYNLNQRLNNISYYLQDSSNHDLETVMQLTPSGSESLIPDDTFLAILSPTGEIGISQDTIYKTDGFHCLIYHKNQHQQAVNLLKALKEGNVLTTEEGININNIQAYKVVVKKSPMLPNETVGNISINTTGSLQTGKKFNNGFMVVFELWAGNWVIRSSAGARTEMFGYHCNWLWCDWYQRPTLFLQVSGVFDGYQVVPRKGQSSYLQDIGKKVFDVPAPNNGIAKSIYLEYTQVPQAPKVGFYGKTEGTWGIVPRTYSNHKAIGGNNNSQTLTQYFEW